MSKDDEIHIKSGTITKGIIGVLVLIILVLLYFVATNHSTTPSSQVSAALSSANQTIASQNTRINALQANLSSLQSENNNQQRLLMADNNTIISLNSDLNNKSSTVATCAPSVSSAAIPTLLSNLAAAPLVVLASQANTGSNLISIGNGTEGGIYGNSESQQIENEYGVSPSPNSYILQAFGSSKILIAGYYASGTTQAGNQFIQDLYSEAQSNASSSKGISFKGVQILDLAGQPVVQIVVGDSAVPSDGVVASNIAAAIGNLAYTYIPVTCSVSR